MEGTILITARPSFDIPREVLIILFPSVRRRGLNKQDADMVLIAVPSFDIQNAPTLKNLSLVSAETGVLSS